MDDLRSHLTQLQHIHQQRLRVLEQQAATFGLSTPPHIQLELDSVRAELARIAVELPQSALPTARADHRPRRNPAIRLVSTPTPLTILIGRERVIADACSLLRRPDMRLLTLIGPGGIGKTRLGLAMAAELRDDFADGICFVVLAPIADPDLLSLVIAQALGITETDCYPLMVLIKEALYERQMLLVLDNFEQILVAAPLLTELLTAAPHIKMLVTSRAVLHLSGEHAFAVPPLMLPAPQQLPPLEQLIEYEAIRLFVERARAVKPGFVVTDEHASAVVEICARLDGLPLAIELAAARSRLLTPPALLARLENRLQVLTAGARDLPTRQQTLRGAIDWSYDLLDTDEQTLFERLAIFSGGCTLEAAEMICNINSGPRLDVLDGLSSLLDKSLIREIAGPDGEPRFSMLETIWEYAQERLKMSGRLEQLLDQHADYYLMLAKRAEPELRRQGQDKWLKRLEAEHHNFRAILQRAITGDQPERAAHLIGHIWRYWQNRGHMTEGRQWLQAVLARKEALSPAMRQWVFYWAGTLARFQGDDVQAQERFEESLALARLSEDHHHIVLVLKHLGLLMYDQRKYLSARPYFEECQSLAWEIRCVWGISDSLNALCRLEYDQGNSIRAKELREQSLGLAGCVGSKQNLARVLNNLGEIMRDQGDHDQATLLLGKSLAIRRELGDTLGIAESLANLGIAMQRAGDLVQATALLSESLLSYQQVGNKLGIAVILEGLAEIAGCQQQLVRAAQLFGAAEMLREVLHEPLPLTNRPNYDQQIGVVRTMLGAQAFAASWLTGRSLSLDQVIAEALAHAPGSAASSIPTTGDSGPHLGDQ